jgi:hypothetical protein
MDRCLGTKRDGSPCTVTVEPPQTHCWWHAPENADARRRAAARGGKRAGRGRPQAETNSIKALLEDLTERVLAGDLPTGPAAVANQLVNTRLRTIEQERKNRETEDLEARIIELERTHEREKRPAPWRGA